MTSKKIDPKDNHKSGKSESGEDWAFWNTHFKEMQKTITKTRISNLEIFCDTLGISKMAFAVNSYRLIKIGKPVIDYYPPSGKVYNHKTKKWDKPENLLKYLKAIYE